jgi:hypothetical protein
MPGYGLWQNAAIFPGLCDVDAMSSGNHWPIGLRRQQRSGKICSPASPGQWRHGHLATGNCYFHRKRDRRTNVPSPRRRRRACRRMHLAVRPILDCRKRRNARLACCSRLRDSTRLSPSSNCAPGTANQGLIRPIRQILLSFLLDFYSIYDSARQIYRFGTLW